MKLAYTLFALLIPTLEAATIFPICKEEAAANCMFNRSYACHLQQVAELYPSNEAVRVTMQENDRLYKAWDYLRDAKTEPLPFIRKSFGGKLPPSGNRSSIPHHKEDITLRRACESQVPSLWVEVSANWWASTTTWFSS